MNKVRIIAKVARPEMVIEYDFLNHDIFDRVELKKEQSLILKQIKDGHALSINAIFAEYDDHNITQAFDLPLCMAGLCTSYEAINVADIWFYPTVHMPKYAKSLLTHLPRFIKGLMVVGGYTSARTLLDPNNEKFKKFAKLCKFHYSSKLEINDIQFEEWEFEGL